MKEPERKSTGGRRDFIKSVAGVSGAAAVALAAGEASAAVEPAPEATKAGGYRVTDHVRDYYETARI